MSNNNWNDDDGLLDLGTPEPGGKKKRDAARADEDELLSLDRPGKKRKNICGGRFLNIKTGCALRADE